MKENPYQAIPIEKESLDKIKKHIEIYGYACIAHFVRCAIRDKIEYDNKYKETTSSKIVKMLNRDNFNSMIFEDKIGNGMSEFQMKIDEQKYKEYLNARKEVLNKI